MKPGARTLGVAVSAAGDERGRARRPPGERSAGDPRSSPPSPSTPSQPTESTSSTEGHPDRAVVAGAVVRVDRVVDGLALSSCTVGGQDATAAVVDCFERLGRADVRNLLLAGVAPAWFNLVDLEAVATAVDRPALAVSFEASPGLDEPLRDHFSGDALADRLATYRSLPERVRVWPTEEPGIDDDRDPDRAAAPLWVRAAGCDAETARRVVRAHVHEGRRRPEPVRVARFAARAGRAFLPTAGDG